ncbi:Proline-rich nuclear receptor coactivator motif [Teratosphaeria destructans]|uniref:Proline-rich nuclear receptor coactivator motif n=1 Tax=Teratosphaeria destructans TaxID=418781 RepID=A0A9W7VYJ4_9PEZI|nr:Proline-rich nuclear receptor coactivator motif [Teratosphaeria destructans]
MSAMTTHQDPNAVNASESGRAPAQPSPSTTPAHPKRSNRHKKNQPQAPNQCDGTVSDSVTGPAPSPRSKKQNKQRQQSAHVAGTTNQNGAVANGHKPRPASLGGPLLPATPGPKEQAYAGPTFHASPAPSSLPVPKFFSKSVPNGAAGKQSSLQARMEGEKGSEKQESSPEPDVVVPVEREAQQSPLDLFFKADKMERERTRSNGMLSPELTNRKAPSTEPPNPFRQSVKNIFMREMDGEHEDMSSPKTVSVNSKPFPGRLDVSSSSGRPQSSDEQRQADTQNLKNLLFNNIQSPSTANAPHQTQQRVHSDANIFNTPSPPPFQRSTSGPVTPGQVSGQQPNYHYGNRDLSPLFKAARSDTPTRPSNLRQELPSAHLPSARPMSQHDAQARGFLDQQIRNQPGSLPLDIAFLRTASSNPTATGSSASTTFDGPPQQGAFGSQQGVPGMASPRTDSAMTKDIGSMEDDLRRMLKLNVLG